jgi:hypothetical protein
MNKLSEIQAKLKVPKEQYNNFGKYKYRSCEDILEAVKQVLVGYSYYLIISDQLENFGDRYYVCACVSLYDENSCVIAQTKAYAREEEVKKGMDGSQITGTASSYARKYALNGMFCIDDTKDSDFTNTHGKELKSEVLYKKYKENLEKITMIDELKNYWIIISNAIQAQLLSPDEIESLTSIKNSLKSSLELPE